MLQHRTDKRPIAIHGFLVAVEIEEGSTTAEQVSLRLAESLSFMEGTGHCDVETLGVIDIYEAPDALATVTLTEEPTTV